MKPRKTPQEKKRLSYQKDCRNSYGENDKASRKAIRKRKSWVNKSYRRTINQVLQNSTNLEESNEKLQNKIKEVKRKNWKKHPDTPLGEYLREKRNRK